MAVWDLADQPFAARRTPALPSHVGRGAGLIDEDQAFGVELGLNPYRPRRSHIRSILLSRAHAFF
jgi:hypothetical protein